MGGSAWAAILMGTGPTTGYSPISGTGVFRPSFCLSITSYPSFVSALLLPTDNVTVAAYINKQGGTRSTRLKSCGHGAGAGILSRSPITAPGRTSLLRTSCPAAAFPPRSGPSTPRSWPFFSRTLGPLYVDLFASALYAQLQRYCAQALDPAAGRIEPSRFGGRYSRGTFFPRPIPRILQKVRQDRATVPLIAPWWPKRTWFLVMITLVVGYPRTLPVRRDVISQPIPGTLHSRPSALHLTAWPLSGRPELRQVFLKGCGRCCPAAGGILPERCTFPSCRIFQLVRISGGGSLFGTSDGRGRFLSSLFDKGRLFSKIRGFRSAIAAIHTGFPDGSCVPTAPSLTGWVHVFFLERPPAQKFLPTWSLPCVLEALAKAPFEPLAEASLRDVTIKTVFLMAIASGHRRSALRALPAPPRPHSLRWGAFDTEPLICG